MLKEIPKILGIMNLEEILEMLKEIPKILGIMNLGVNCQS